jgi:hypothetical protein
MCENKFTISEKYLNFLLLILNYAFFDELQKPILKYMQFKLFSVPKARYFL